MSPAPSGQAPGGEQEFTCFYREHVRRLVAYLIYRGAPAHLAAELAQEAMIAAYRRWNAITSPRAYVYKVADTFLCHVLDGDELPVAEVPEPTVMLPYPEEAEAWLQRQEIVEVLRALPLRQRQVLALTIDGWPPVDIAALLGIDASAVRSNLRKARRNADKHHRIGREDP